MHLEINIIVPTALALVAIIGLWFNMASMNAKPNSGLLLVPVESSSFSALS